jgi:alkanesulfonate monooxygenase SsuD/methylene tetrahydromethanopterin reductase-like flavin-dependent oxidoreductase (luciferase family)
MGMGRDMTLEEIGDEAKLIEDLGFKQVTLRDSQDLDPDVYVMMSVVAMKTNKILIGQGVTVPGTRIPSVTGNATASIDALSGGRAFLAIGAGASAMWTQGKDYRPVKEMRATVSFIRDYIQGKEAKYYDVSTHNQWIKKPYPIYMACSGPSSCRLAGELADGVIMGPGSHPEVAKWRMELIARGAEKAGRDPSKIDYWARTFVVLGDNKTACMREASGFGIRNVWMTLGLRSDTPEVQDLYRRLSKQIPDLDGLIAEGKKCYDAYEPYWHERIDAPHTKFATQRVIDFIHLTGTADDVSEGVEKLRDVGVNNISTVNFTLVDRKAMYRRIAKEVMPRFQ